jgi:hypothetical protein
MRFEDETGAVWNCRIDVAAIFRAKAAGIDLGNVEPLLGQFYACSAELYETLWAVLRPQAELIGINRDTFNDRMRGDVVERARDCLLEGLQDFFPSQRRAMLAEALRMIEAEVVSRLPKSFSAQPEKSA